MTKMSSRQFFAGITMIEVLIVATIVGLLTVMMVVSIRSHLLRSDDAQRKTDLKKISQALEQYYNDHGGYPASLAVAVGGATCGTSTILTPYMKDVPCDPNGGTSRPYLYIPQGTSKTGGRGSETVYTGFRLLTALQYASDPQIAEIGCPNGCGGSDGANVAVPTIYNFGFAANAAVNMP